MHSVVVLSGDLLDDAACRAWLVTADDIICADGGARHLRRLGIRPDLLIGDLDSIRPPDLDWCRQQNVAIERYPVQKDETDAELTLDAAIRRYMNRLALCGCDQAAAMHHLTVFGALGSRPDHVLANQLLAARLARPDRQIMLSDGITRIYAMAGPGRLDIVIDDRTVRATAIQKKDLPDGYEHEEIQCRDTARTWLVSAVAISDRVEGLTYEGLAYPLDNATLERGSTRGVSNRFAEPADPAEACSSAQDNKTSRQPVMAGPPARTGTGLKASVACRSGTLLVLVTPDDQGL